ncbi:aspartyl protease family protein 2-like [Nicotiana tomentosiformis]|uniref:aspartyl protease family protein 2-like n=1 Tax=Nicotiana tomentosiformis TaxID=4098 RepID=UPI00051ADC0E|nr:aspartyl protease family protein 2-like [Nicotiana tomentosiformis]
MEGKLISIPFLFTLFTLSISVSSVSLQYQTLTLRSLPEPQSLSWATQDSYDFQPLNSQNTLAVQLHHVDLITPYTSLFNTTPHALFKLRLQRDAVRAELLSKLAEAAANANATVKDFSSSVISGLAQGSGEYFTRIGIGTPPKYAYLVLDTGSDVVWIQCLPCRQCYNQSDPVFDPSKSSSFTGLSCDSPLCRRLDSPGCNNKNKCLYQVSYGDGSFTVGEFSTETLTFRKTRVSDIAFGCGHDNEGLFIGAAGLLGLGKGKLSFPGQAGSRFGNKFSYCLVDRTGSPKPSYLIFGESAVTRNTIFTPLLTNQKLNTFYYVELTGISVGGTRVPLITSELFKLGANGDGGVIVDSGTSVTRLTRPAYVALRDAFSLGTKNLKRAPNYSLFDTCYDLSGKTEVKVPTLVLHFKDADVALPASNYLIPVSSEGRFCFGFAGTASGLSIIGNIQQQGFRVVFDLAGSRLGFAPRGCD